MNPDRRRLLLGGIALIATPAGALAQQCRVTPRDALGPFYVKGAPSQAELCASGSGGSQKLAVSGRVLGMPDCAALAGAVVEVWQADARGDYTQVGGRRDDPGCLLRASLRCDAEGRYAFRTVLPGEYPGRPRHLHYRVSAKGYATLVTQLYFERERGVADALVVKAVPKDGVLAATFDVTLSRS
jgi:protocatechuate 3,4-dioxygenase beta subunit